MIGQIVNEIFFSGEYWRARFDDKGRVTIKKPLIKQLKARHPSEEEVSDINLFYRIHLERKPEYIEITDMLDDKSDSYTYKPKKLDNQNRLLILKEELELMGIGKMDTIVLVGNNNQILIYEYKKYRSSLTYPKSIIPNHVRGIGSHQTSQ